MRTVVGAWAGRAAAGLWLLVGCAAPAAAVSPALEQALEIQAKHLAKLRGVTLVCEGVAVAVDAGDAWATGKAMLVATFSANGVSEETIAAVGAALDAVPSDPDCADEALRGGAEHMASDWTGRIGYQLEQLGLAVVANPPRPADWEAIRAIVADEVTVQARMFDCLAVREPLWLPEEVKRWDDEIADATALLVGRGFDRNAVATLFAPIEAGVIWKPAASDTEATLRADCDANAVWYEDWSAFKRASVLKPIEALLQ